MTLLFGVLRLEHIKKINNIQNGAVKIIGGGWWRESASSYHAQLKILKLQELYRLELTSFMYKFNKKQMHSSFFINQYLIKFILNKQDRQLHKIILFHDIKQINFKDQ